MLLEFKLYKANIESRLFKIVSKYDVPNEFIVVGEVDDCFLVQQLTGKGLVMVGGFPLDEMAYSIAKKDLFPLSSGMGTDYTEIEIPKEYLTLDLIEKIQKLNS